MSLPPGEEHVVLVDDADRELGIAPKATVHGADTPLHRAFSLFLFDTAGRLLLQRRSGAKKTWPLVWSNSCCGHPARGESVVDAARRRLRDELGIVGAEMRVALPHYRYRAERDGVVENEICPVLVGLTDAEAAPNPDEVDSVRWIAWDEWVDEVRAHPDDYSPWCVEETLLLAADPLSVKLSKTPRPKETS